MSGCVWSTLILPVYPGFALSPPFPLPWRKIVSESFVLGTGVAVGVSVGVGLKDIVGVGVFVGASVGESDGVGVKGVAIA